MRSASRVLPIILLFLVAGRLYGQDLFWENPRPLSEGRGRYPVALKIKDGLVAIWQESSTTGDLGQIRLSLARFSGGVWSFNRQFAGPYDFRGPEPIIFSAAAADGRLAVAAASGPGTVEILVSADAGASFERRTLTTPQKTTVAARVYPSASGGWLLFAAQGEGQPEASPASPASPTGQAGALPIYCSSSHDGRDWAPFSPLVQSDEHLDLNFLPAASPLPSATGTGRTDVVVFQSLSGGDRPSFQLWSKLSRDGGRSWSTARRISGFNDPVNKEKAAPDNFDNQRPNLAIAGGRLWIAWERSLRGAQAQVYAASLDQSGLLAPVSVDRVSSGAGACANPQVLVVGDQPGVVWFDNRRGGNRVFLALHKGVDWVESDLSGASGESSFGRAVSMNGKIYALWQNSSATGDHILVLEPKTHADPPRLAALDFTPGKRSRQEKVTIRVDIPSDAVGIAGYSYLWTQDEKAEPPHHLMALTTQTRLEEGASADGPWYLAATVQDFAGNWSTAARIRFDRKRSPPPPPMALHPNLDERGFLASNSFAVTWVPPVEDDIAGYTWELRFAGGLEGPGAQAGLKPTPEARPPLPDLTSYEAALVERVGLPQPPPAILGTASRASYSNVDDGYYLFSVAAVDETGNISAPSTILLRANKYVPYTTVTLADATHDDLGRTNLRILGRGFLADGKIERVVLDRKGAAPFDLERDLDQDGFRIASDREIGGFSFEDAEQGTYRIGLFHSTRGWYWTRPLVAVDVSGTVKFGLDAPYQPSWKLVAPRSYRFSIYDAFILAAVLFALLGVVLSLRQALVAVSDGAAVRLQVLALVNGGPMPSDKKRKEVRKLRKRGAGLRVKFTLIIALLVIFVVLLVSVPLVVRIIRTQSMSLANGLQQRAEVLLESVAQGARSYLPTQDSLQLGFLPQQAQAMNDALYITVTGYGAKSTEPDAVWASNDPGLGAKIDGSELRPGASRLKDALSPDIARIAGELDRQAAAEVGDINKTIADLSQEGRTLVTRTDEASKRRFDEISQTIPKLQSTLNQRLFILAAKASGSTPRFDSGALSLRPERFLFYKPVLYRSGSDQLFYRGMVRLEIKTDDIVKEVLGARADLVRITFLIAAVALGLGIVGAFILSTVIVVPIKKLVAQIGRVRDTEDKEELEGERIEVASRDELYTLADTVNQMTEGLVRAAKASKELIVGKGIQKMFIPLDAGPGRAKLSTGRHDEKTFEIYGYYEGAKGVSGDYWDFRDINSRYHYFIKCDISGKGVSAALIMVEVATMVINYFNGWKQTFPKNIDLTDLAYKINDFIEERGYEGKRFAAFTVGVWDAQAGIAYLCEAGDRKLHVWNAKERRLLEELLPDSPAAGIFPSFMVKARTPYTQIVRRLESGDVLLLYTDGIEEAKRHFRDPAFTVVPCSQTTDPYVFLAEFLVERLKLDASAGANGHRLLEGSAAAAFARSLAASVTERLAAKSTAAVARTVIDEAARKLADTVMDQLGRGTSRRGRPGENDRNGTGMDGDAAIELIRQEGERMLKRACEETLLQVDRHLEGAYAVRPGADYIAERLPAAITAAASSMSDQLAEQVAEYLVKANRSLGRRDLFMKLREPLAAMSGGTLADFEARLGGRLASRLRDLPDARFVAAPPQAHLKRLAEESAAEIGERLAAALSAAPTPKAAEEVAKLAAGEGMEKLADELINRAVSDGNHKVGEDNEEFGYERITAVLEAVDGRGSYRLVKSHVPESESAPSFDFSACQGTLEEKVLALIAVEKVFRMYPDPAAAATDVVLVDEKVDAFLEKHFDQYRLYCTNKRPYVDPQNENPGYLLYEGAKEDDQYDDLTILGIRRK